MVQGAWLRWCMRDVKQDDQEFRIEEIKHRKEDMKRQEIKMESL